MAVSARIASASLALLLLFCFSEAREFTVGGKNNAWNDSVSNPNLLNDWSGKLRFQVLDTLKWTGPGAQVGREQYDSCNASSPIAVYQSGETATLDRPGYFFFISQNQDSCNKGRKVIVLVISPRHKSSSAPAFAPESAPSPAGAEEGAGSPAGSPAVPRTSGAGGLRIGGGGLAFGLGVLVWSLF